MLSIIDAGTGAPVPARRGLTRVEAHVPGYDDTGLRVLLVADVLARALDLGGAPVRSLLDSDRDQTELRAGAAALGMRPFEDIRDAGPGMNEAQVIHVVSEGGATPGGVRVSVAPVMSDAALAPTDRPVTWSSPAHTPGAGSAPAHMPGAGSGPAHPPGAGSASASAFPPGAEPASAHPPGAGSTPAHTPGAGSGPAHPPGAGSASASAFPPGAEPASAHPPGAGSAPAHMPGAGSASAYRPGAGSASAYRPGAGSASAYPPGAEPASAHPPGAGSAPAHTPGTSSGPAPDVLRLALLSVHHSRPARIDPAALADAHDTLVRWRRAVAAWARQPSRPVPDDVRAELRTAWEDDLDVPGVLRVLHRVETSDLPEGARFETYVYTDRLLGLELARDLGAFA